MGKTKIKVIDDSKVPEAPQPKKETKRDELVERLKAELGEGISKEAEEIKEEPKKDEVKKKVVKKGVKEKQKVKIRSKKYQQKLELIDKQQSYPLQQAIDLAQKVSISKFDGTIEAHINTTAKNLKLFAPLPFSLGKKVRILAFGPSAELGIKPGEEKGGVISGDEKTIDEIEKGKVDFDIVISTPEWMSKLTKVAKVLGPKGLMPNPKNNTITQNLKKAITEIQSGKVEVKSEPNGHIIHTSVGKVSQPVDQITTNIKALVNTIGKSKIKKIALAPTIGPSVKVDLSTV